ncbi:MAG TPA: protein-L-isoaspartate(D-aspartate) O-methyltransferase [Polyangiaceae bacterium]|jgi:protein-L-isoaspartate(D-aspartate) O-methyltransferase
MGTQIETQPPLSEGASRLRAMLVEEGVDRSVVDAMMRVPREEFVPEPTRDLAYEDAPLSIGLGQTISQPTLVGLMTDLLRLHRRCRVLEIGTGCGYQTAILAELAGQVASIELEPSLSDAATARLRRLGYRNVETRVGDGYLGWPERAPFDAIIVTASAPHVPPALAEELAPGGRMVLPVESELRLVTKDERGDVAAKKIARVSFVPLRRAPA